MQLAGIQIIQVTIVTEWIRHKRHSGFSGPITRMGITAKRGTGQTTVRAHTIIDGRIAVMRVIFGHSGREEPAHT